jgi:hypothetical protein
MNLFNVAEGNYYLIPHGIKDIAFVLVFDHTRTAVVFFAVFILSKTRWKLFKPMADDEHLDKL